jgi:hypothetical protein
LNITPTLGGTIRLNGNNTYSGTTTFNAGPFGNGTIIIGNNSAFGTSTFSWGQAANSTGGNLVIAGGDKTIANTIINQAGQNAAIFGSDNLTFSGPYTSAGGKRQLTNNLASEQDADVLQHRVSVLPMPRRSRCVWTAQDDDFRQDRFTGPGASSLQISTSGAVFLRGQNTYGFLSAQSGTITLDMPNAGLYSASLTWAV